MLGTLHSKFDSAWFTNKTERRTTSSIFQQPLPRRKPRGKGTYYKKHWPFKCFTFPTDSSDFQVGFGSVIEIGRALPSVSTSLISLRKLFDNPENKVTAAQAHRCSYTQGRLLCACGRRDYCMLKCNKKLRL